jgi:hypothetical protein
LETTPRPTIATPARKAHTLRPAHTSRSRAPLPTTTETFSRQTSSKIQNHRVPVLSKMKRSSDAESAPRTAQSLTIALSQEDLDALSKISDLTHTHPSTLAYQCFRTGLTFLPDSLRQPWEPHPPNSPLPPEPPKRNAKYVTIYITERDLSNLHAYPRLRARSFPPRSILRELAAHWTPKLTALAYTCFRKGLALKLQEKAANAPVPLTP